MAGDHRPRVFPSDGQAGAGEMAGGVFEHVLAGAVHDGHVDADLRDQELAHRIQSVDGQLAPVFVVALEVALGLAVEHGFADLRLARLVKSLVVFDR